MVKYPDHVAKAVFYSPGPLWHLPTAAEDYSRTAAKPPGPLPYRLIAAMLLFGRNPDAAVALLPQWEAEELLVPVIEPAWGRSVCKNHANLLGEVAHVNPYADASLEESTEESAVDPHARLSTNSTPAIILFAECDFVLWKAALEYRKTLPNARLYYLPGAGHTAQLEKPELMIQIIAAFLLDQPDAIPSYAGDADPRTSRADSRP
jgi:pimeloyl-ACP methyl ester carboxylesterase